MPTVDPSDPDTFEPEAGTDDAENRPLSDETPEADAVEQHTDLTPDKDNPLTTVDPDLANEADAAEQTRVVVLDEDDYR
ncbi:hypothetical protein ACIQM4_06345 [Streptomyces sp. NPDC091272]|uniref:hypothetical protein n=1 Tax=Streptomyces sp. NPDC091272 TaxID=3365981 RepID=UPI0037F81E4E